MLSSVLAMQSAIAQRNNAQLSMMRNSDLMLKAATSFGSSQPLSPAAISMADSLELQNKANETKVTVLQKNIEALEQSMAQKIKRSIPNYAGLNYKA